MKQYRLQLFGLPIINDLKDLSDHLHLSKSLLYRLSKFNSRHYVSFSIPKKNGTLRLIHCPNKEMKAVQAWILRNILEKIILPDPAMGFREKRGIRENALAHKGNQYFLSLDVDDFFPSIGYSKVYNIFKMMGYNLHVAHLLTSLCTCNAVLPQGGVTSPMISNIVCIHLDKRIAGYVGKHNVTYTRYADDLTFSSLSFMRLLRIKKFIERILSEEGFNLNKEKTRFMGKRVRREVTGLVLGENTVGVGRQKKRILRVKIFQLLRDKINEENKAKQINHINGWLSFLAHIDKEGVRMLERYACSLDKTHGLRFPT